jgi:transcriptional regulator with XRE-family HTH domain
MNEVFSERLKEARVRAGMKAKELALKCGISASYLSELESGKRTNPANLLVEKFALELSVPTDWLLGSGELLHNLHPNGHRGAHLPAGTEIDLAGAGEKHVVRDAPGTYGAPPWYHLTTWRPSWSTILGEMSDCEIMAEIRHGVDRIESKPRGSARAHQCHGLMDYLNELANRKEKEGNGA